MSDIHTSEYADEPRSASPGQLLQHERERQAISLEDAALALHLRPAVVAGLEQDHYAEIPVATYRRGYLRTYAKYLGMDDKPVLEAYRARYGNADTESEIKPVSVTRPPSKLGGLLFKLVTLLVIAGLIGVTVTWWQSRGGNTPPGLDDTTAAETAPETANAPDMPSTSDAPAASTEPRDEAKPSDTGSSTEANPRAASTAEPEAATLSKTALAAATAVARAAQERADAATANTLALTFNQQSWTEIFDARDQRVFVGLQQPGTDASVEGQPPFRLTVGNATGVELRYQGKVVDLARHAGANNVARFTLGE
ncbi:RodZ domain-containing protein [Vreelandella subglaciescola]|jgi:cytoskeleton protein RodZ|uniref:Cytoskeleton protein RodZ n=1 Tax=Vreelandella subglaciescola TaxID=29571 RepID=A0A1M7G2V1_9GAMM|nr:RodZ domain-containing protein [Halomonas subglaciescola]SHM10287.1 cytoskeleton protein RodZ [Halomonas subglaciescola]